MCPQPDPPHSFCIRLPSRSSTMADNFARYCLAQYNALATHRQRFEYYQSLPAEVREFVVANAEPLPSAAPVSTATPLEESTTATAASPAPGTPARSVRAPSVPASAPPSASLNPQPSAVSPRTPIASARPSPAPASRHSPAASRRALSAAPLLLPSALPISTVPSWPSPGSAFNPSAATPTAVAHPSSPAVPTVPAASVSGDLALAPHTSAPDASFITPEESNRRYTDLARRCLNGEVPPAIRPDFVAYGARDPGRLMFADDPTVRCE